MDVAVKWGTNLWGYRENRPGSGAGTVLFGDGDFGPQCLEGIDGVLLLLSRHLWNTRLLGYGERQRPCHLFTADRLLCNDDARSAGPFNFADRDRVRVNIKVCQSLLGNSCFHSAHIRDTGIGLSVENRNLNDSRSWLGTANRNLFLDCPARQKSA